tara:strand:+ start:762 stop:1718 length:957 start_codon:yes stop_codon:yes gene_type:complete
MATVFKNLTNNDVAQTKTLLNEAIPLTGTIVSGTYSDENIQNYTHGMFQSVYDYPYLSASSNHIFDITYGYATSSTGATNTQDAKKRNIYNQMAQVLAGYDVTSSIRKFDLDGNYAAGGDTMNECVFLNYSRLLTKDEIKKGSYTLELTTNTLYDAGAQNSYKINSPAGEYGLLYTASDGGGSVVGHIYYQAGIAVITASAATFSEYLDFTGSLSITGAADSVRSEWVDNSFNNTTELNSTIYFCRLNPNEFNYSSNPTYVSGSRVTVKNISSDQPVSYITTIGLYSADNELLAVAKLSEPIKKTDSNALTLRVRMDY